MSLLPDSTGSSTSTSTQPQDTGNTSTSLSTPVIAGIVCGVVVFIGIVAAIVIFAVKRNRNSTSSNRHSKLELAVDDSAKGRGGGNVGGMKKATYVPLA
ncbi:hypothetical protein HDU76_004181 [Blyttiomyces sp. JEL0837]|nr:hypothetical protein HDU76_004181 [Blyttiomyces sp. JEL0837]